MGRRPGARRRRHREGCRRVAPAHRPRPRPRRRPRQRRAPVPRVSDRAGGHGVRRGVARSDAPWARLPRRRRARPPAGRALRARRRRVRPAHVLLWTVRVREDVRPRHDSRAAPAGDVAAADRPRSELGLRSARRYPRERRRGRGCPLSGRGRRRRRAHGRQRARSAARPLPGLRSGGAGGGAPSRPDPEPRGVRRSGRHPRGRPAVTLHDCGRPCRPACRGGGARAPRPRHADTQPRPPPVADLVRRGRGVAPGARGAGWATCARRRPRLARDRRREGDRRRGRPRRSLAASIRARARAHRDRRGAQRLSPRARRRGDGPRDRACRPDCRGG